MQRLSLATQRTASAKEYFPAKMSSRLLRIQKGRRRHKQSYALKMMIQPRPSLRRFCTKGGKWPPLEDESDGLKVSKYPSKYPQEETNEHTEDEDEDECEDNPEPSSPSLESFDESGTSDPVSRITYETADHPTVCSMYSGFCPDYPDDEHPYFQYYLGEGMIIRTQEVFRVKDPSAANCGELVNKRRYLIVLSRGADYFNCLPLYTFSGRGLECRPRRTWSEYVGIREHGDREYVHPGNNKDLIVEWTHFDLHPLTSVHLQTRVVHVTDELTVVGDLNRFSIGRMKDMYQGIEETRLNEEF